MFLFQAGLETLKEFGEQLEGFRQRVAAVRQEVGLHLISFSHYTTPHCWEWFSTLVDVCCGFLPVYISSTTAIRFVLHFIADN